MQGFSIQVYRAKHFDHHRYLGAPNDPERHYFQPLDWRFFVSTLSGTRTLLEIVRLRGAAARSGDGAKGAGPRGPRWVVLAGAGFHVLLVVGAVALGRWPLGVAWTLGFLIWFPFFSMLSRSSSTETFVPRPRSTIRRRPTAR